MRAPILVTGFEPYGGRGRNPAFEAAMALDGERIAGLPVAGRRLPVSFARIKPAIAALLDELDPVAVISLGLYPGEAALRIERIGVNVADFDIPDNDGLCIADGAISTDGHAARLATIPVRAIEQAILAAGIPAHLSATAGLYLCNACLYSFLEALDERRRRVPCGFIHVPYLPEQVAELLATRRGETREPAPSMELARVVAGVRIAIEQTVSALATS